MSEFEKLLQENMISLERYIKYKINNKHDAEDIIQEVCLTATINFKSLRNPSAFKAWLIGIASHKCNDYYRRKAKDMPISLESLSESALIAGRFGVTGHSIVHDTLDVLGDNEKQILYLYFFKEMSQEDIAKELSLPLGTVKSRLHYAKKKFKQHYPYQTISKGEPIMKKLPKLLPEYKIEELDKPPFNVIHEELPGMFIIPRIGETITFGMYDLPSRKQNGFYQLSVTGKIRLHDVDGVIINKEYHDSSVSEKSTVYAQLTDTHCKYLGGVNFNQNGEQIIITFLDSDFDDYYGIGEDNCGFPTHRISEGKICQTPDGLSMSVENDISDIVGCFKITMNNKAYETVRIIDYQNGNNGGMLCEYYVDKNGCTVLWRRFNKNDWADSRYKKPWTELFPENERLIVNGETYVHWYDCVTDYIF